VPREKGSADMKVKGGEKLGSRKKKEGKGTQGGTMWLEIQKTEKETTNRFSSKNKGKTWGVPWCAVYEELKSLCILKEEG